MIKNIFTLSRSRGWCALLFVISSLIPLAVAASPGPLVTDRPDVAESSETVGAWRVQVETAVDVETHRVAGQRYTLLQTPTKLRVGILERLELHLETAGMARAFGEGASEDLGFSDLDFGFKVYLWSQAGLRPSTGLLMALTMPTGTDGVSEELWALSPTLAADWGLGHWGVGVNLGVTTILDPRDAAEDSFRFALAAGRDLAPLSESVRFYAEVFGELGFDGHEQAISADGGVAWVITPNLQLDLSFRVGLSADARDFGSALGLSFRI